MRSTRRNWALLLLGLAAVGYGAIFGASLVASIYDLRTDQRLSDVDRAVVLVQALLAIGLAWALLRGGWQQVVIGLFVAWFALAAVEVVVVDWRWAGAYALSGLIPLWLVWPELRPSRPTA